MSTKQNDEGVVLARYVPGALEVHDLDHPLWNTAGPVVVDRYWSADPAPHARHAEARIIWSDSALTVRFVCKQSEPIVASSRPQTETKTIGLWDRDVCEIFVAPDLDQPQSYFEFEVAPTGEWLDVAVETLPDERRSDWAFDSGMTVATRRGETLVTLAMKIPWKGLGRIPEDGERWRANLFRCIGEGDTRGYLAWQPTRTAQPNFHVPEVFGCIEFIK